ncbi:MAG TPA: hypothetical protein VJS90_07870 [Pseudomonas sp.]|nr:hypothetical protein [Pseudomonas sp.]HKS12945.1 hypothetical protein [Pseudomonas sp.]
MDHDTRSLRHGFFSQLLLSMSISIFSVVLIEVVSGRAQRWLDLWPSYACMLLNINEPLERMRWIVGDISEVMFYKHELPALGLLAGAWLAHSAHRHGHRWQGFAICYGSGLWPWLVTSSSLSLLLSHVLWGWTLHNGTWQPTYVAFVSLPAVVVLRFGRGWKVAITGAVLGAVLVPPASLLLVNQVCYPLELPLVVGNLGGMALASAFGLLLCKRVPWITTESRLSTRAITPEPCAEPVSSFGVIWTMRRVLADFSEPLFLGNEIASLGLLLGVLIAYILSPASPAYGSHLLLEIISGQALASLIGILLWRQQWKRHGWYPTYLPLVSIVPAAVMSLGGQWQVIALSAGLGALVAPPLAVAINVRLPDAMPVFVGNGLAMMLATLVIVPVVGRLTGNSG